MSFLTVSALAVALLVVAPVLAHLLRRRQAEERLFPPARLVPPTPPAARRRSLLEDRALFAVRALAVAALALLGATPFIHCSRLAITRRSGASVALAIVLDDSLSMKARLPGGETRWARALGAARELTAGLAGGDQVAIVLAGAPARVALGSTTTLAAVGEALEGLEPSDRATDLDGAVQLAKGLLRGLAQRDKRVVVLSDLADGSPPDAPPLGGGGDAEIAVWVPLHELAADGQDCAVTRADRSGTKVWARVICTGPAGGPAGGSAGGGAVDGGAVAGARGPVSMGPQAAPNPGPASRGPSAGRSLEVRDGARVLASAPLDPALKSAEIAVDLPPNAPEILRAALTGSDAIPDDDEAPVVAAGGALPMAVVVDTTATHVATGGPPPIEQALSALELDAQVHPLPSVPERAEELDAVAALIVDDVPGFTPEVRRTLAAWVERGGVLLLTLGPRAAAAPLGASFDPLVPGVVRWGPSPSPGVDPATATLFGPSAEGMLDLAPHGRASIDPAALGASPANPGASPGADVLARWKDGAPLLVRRSLGRGAVLALTLPLSTDESDLALRPGFLALLDRFVSTARARGGARRIDVGEVWTFDGYRSVKVERVSLAGPGAGNDKPRPVPVFDAASGLPLGLPPAGAPAAGEPERRLRAAPPLAGLYALELDGDRTTRVAAVPEREIDLRPRRVRDEARAASLGGVDPSLDVSPYVALLLLALFAAELVLRLLGQRAAHPQTPLPHAGRPSAMPDAEA
jgi:von Willebrand factor type A domain/Aerotolerance regulator N-terminal